MKKGNIYGDKNGDTNTLPFFMKIPKTNNNITSVKLLMCD